jgi:uncharacterized protein
VYGRCARHAGTTVTDRSSTSTLLDLRQVTTPEVPVHRVFKAEQLAPVADSGLNGSPANGAAVEEPGADTADYTVLGDVHFDGTVRKDEPRFILSGRLQARLQLICGRCLEPFTLPVDTQVDLTYVPHPAVAADDEVELSQDDLTTAFYRDLTLDLGEMVREQFYLALPMRPLCREDCKGLCPQCGTNLNQGTCACDVRWEDPRLEGLRALMKKKTD